MVGSHCLFVSINLHHQIIRNSKLDYYAFASVQVEWNCEKCFLNIYQWFLITNSIIIGENCSLTKSSVYDFRIVRAFLIEEQKIVVRVLKAQQASQKAK